MLLRSIDANRRFALKISGAQTCTSDSEPLKGCRANKLSALVAA
jgi:hypothetical protein